MLKKLINNKLISQKVSKIAKEIFSFYNKKEFIIISLLKGSFIFTADLVRELSKYTDKFELYFLDVKSYSGYSSTGKVNIYGEFPDVNNKNILLIDDILDSGNTFFEILKLIENKNIKSLKTCFFLVKNVKRKYNIPVDYFCFEIENKFVVGYGLDYNEKYRGLPFIAQLGD